MKAIPTVYRGIQMRSRLEAKWAAYFDLRGDIQWEYEPLDYNGWIPDFTIKMDEVSLPALAEVKPVFDIKHFAESPDGKKVLRAITQDCLAFVKCHRSLLLLGPSPSHVWMWPSPKSWVKIPPPPDAHELWACASNRAQWKAPR